MTAPDEELLPATNRRRRLVVELVLVAVLLAAAVVIAVRASGGHTHHPRALPGSAIPNTTPANSYGTGNGLLAEQPPELPSRAAGDPAACPWPHGCVEGSAVPFPVRAAVHAAVPYARIFACASVRLVTGPLWYREVGAVSSSGGRLLIVIEVARPGTAVEPAHLEGESSVSSVRLQQYVVTVRFDWPHAPAAAVDRLIRDPRLLVG